ncbi:40486_t:CDS:2, partial [Gigaspora margarita]
ATVGQATNHTNQNIFRQLISNIEDLTNLEGSLLILFPSNPQAEWIRPDVKFQLSYNVIRNILYLFEDRLEDIGERLIESFTRIYIKQDSRGNILNRYLIESSRYKNSSNKPVNQTFVVQRQNNNHQLQRLQNTGSFQRALNTGRQAAGPQTIPNLFIDTYTPVQQYNDLIGGSNPFFITQDVEISPQ